MIWVQRSKSFQSYSSLFHFDPEGHLPCEFAKKKKKTAKNNQLEVDYKKLCSLYMTIIIIFINNNVILIMITLLGCYEAKLIQI